MPEHPASHPVPYRSAVRIALYNCLILLLSVVSACHADQPLPSPLWFYSHSGNTTRNNTPSKWDTVLTGASFLEMRSDGSYTQDFGQFDYGRWNLKGQDLYLTNQHHTTYIFRLLTIEKKEIQINLAKGRIAYFDKQPAPPGSLSEDPFSQENNQWRIPATHKENIDELRQRLHNHYQFWETYFQWAADNKITLDVRDVPSPMKIYGNGFGLKRYDSLPVRWRSYFYDTTDCHNADTLIKGIFRRNKIKWPDTDDQSKLFISGIRQVEEFLK